jgi:hypothetical protein
MKVKELVQLLQDFDGEKTVIIDTNEKEIDEMCVNAGLNGEIVITEF